MRAAESPRYVAVKPARQSSAGGVTYVSTDCGTGLPRVANVRCTISVGGDAHIAPRIAQLYVLRRMAKPGGTMWASSPT
ncbi:MAG: hypothetical protein LBM98_01080 [Oscillospiraceae bacterium]|nr:hypothetical protein [Oscillospiraceae bacterium]